MKKLLTLVVVIIVLAGGVFTFFHYQKQQQLGQINSFEKCASAGFPIMESYPEQCRTPDGRLFVHEIGNELTYSDEIILETPRPNQSVHSPLKIAGRARGTWFFEADFPIELVDANNNSLGTGHAQALDEWMTEDFVSFEGKILFKNPTTKTGKLLIRNANPSGLPENQKELVMPLQFEK